MDSFVFTYSADAPERIEIGYLARASSEAVVEWLKAHWHEPEKGIYGDMWRHDDEGRRLLEYVLYRRNDPFIDYGLVRYGFSLNVIQRVYDRGDETTRLAAIGNPNGSTHLEQAKDILVNGKYRAIKLLLQNKYITGGFIKNLLSREGAFSGIDDDRLFLIVLAIRGNERLNRPYESLYLDGFDDYLYHEAFSAAWELTKSVQVNQRWASALWDLLANCQKPVSFEELEETIQRWQIDEPIDVDGEVEWFKRSPSFFVRALLGGVKENDDELLNSDDPAMRVGFYRRFQPYKYRDWSKFIERDGGEFINAALDNENIWRSAEYRDQLSSACWDAPDPSHMMDVPNDFRGREDTYRERHPEWFADEDDNSSGEPGVILERIDRLEEQIARLEEQISIAIRTKRGLFS